MEITLAGLRVMETHSEETVCFSAVVVIDGKAAFHAMNDGHGGSHRYDPLPGQSADEMRTLVAWARTFAASQPGMPWAGTTLPMDLDLYLAQIIDRIEQEKWLRARVGTKTVFRLPSDEAMSYRVLHRKFTPEVAADIRAKYGTDAEIMNETLAAQ